MIGKLVAVGMLIGTAASAGDLVKSQIPICDLEFTGEIESGDLAQFERIGYKYNNTNVCFDSGGGSLDEGLKIFGFIWRANVNTLVLPGDHCESACALAFMGGSNVQGTDVTRQIDRAVFPGAKVGFHGPSLELPSGRVQPTEVVRRAFLNAIDVSSRLFSINQIEEKGGRALSDFLFGAILRTPSDQMYFVTSVGDAVLAGVSPVGISYSLRRSPEEARNVCENVLASNPPDGLYYTSTSSDEEFYRGLLDPFGRNTDGGSSWLEGVQAEITNGADGAVYGTVGPFFSGSKFYDIQCRLQFPSEAGIRSLGEFNREFPASLHDEFFSVELRHVPVGRDFDEGSLIFDGFFPPWYMYNHSTILSHLPIDTAYLSWAGVSHVPFLESETTGRELREYVGFDLPGHDLSVLRQVPLEACKRACLATASCVAATYDRWNQFCFLKASDGGAGVLKRNSKADTFATIEADQQLSFDKSSVKVGRIQNKIFVDAPFSSVGGQTFNTCSSICLARQDCVAFDLSVSSVCRIFRRPSAYTDSSRAVVGLIYQE